MTAVRMSQDIHEINVFNVRSKKFRASPRKKKHFNLHLALHHLQLSHNAFSFPRHTFWNTFLSTTSNSITKCVWYNATTQTCRHPIRTCFPFQLQLKVHFHSKLLCMTCACIRVSAISFLQNTPRAEMDRLMMTTTKSCQGYTVQLSSLVPTRWLPSPAIRRMSIVIHLWLGLVLNNGMLMSMPPSPFDKSAFSFVETEIGKDW